MQASEEISTTQVTEENPLLSEMEQTEEKYVIKADGRREPLDIEKLRRRFEQKT